MKYFILKDKKTEQYLCRVEVEERDCTILNHTFENYIASECYGEYKVYKMTKELFDKGKITPIHTLRTIEEFVNKLGYHPY